MADRIDQNPTTRLNIRPKVAGHESIQEAACHFGQELAHKEQNRGLDWFALEAQARREWKERFPNTAWFEIRHLVQVGWQGAQANRKPA